MAGRSGKLIEQMTDMHERKRRKRTNENNFPRRYSDCALLLRYLYFITRTQQICSLMPPRAVAVVAQCIILALLYQRARSNDLFAPVANQPGVILRAGRRCREITNHNIHSIGIACCAALTIEKGDVSTGGWRDRIFQSQRSRDCAARDDYQDEQDNEYPVPPARKQDTRTVAARRPGRWNRRSKRLWRVRLCLYCL